MLFVGGGRSMAEGFGEWASRLRRYVAACRASRPIPDRSTLTNAQEWQYHIISSSVRAGMRKYTPRYFREEAVMNRRFGFNNPVFVFTSSVPGLIAAKDAIGTGHEQVVLLLENEYDASPCGEEGTEDDFYRHFWSTVDTEAELDPEYVAGLRAEHPIPDGCSYWRHCEGSYSGPMASHWVAQLWCWDGGTATMIEGAWQSIIS